jgi:hypothetical protein
MAKVIYDKQLTALLVIDPYNDFVSGPRSLRNLSGGKLDWNPGGASLLFCRIWHDGMLLPKLILNTCVNVDR